MNSPLLQADRTHRNAEPDTDSSWDLTRNTTQVVPNMGAKPRRVDSDFKKQTVVCVILHAGIILLHLALFIVYSHHYEHRLTVDWTESRATWLPTAVTILSQLIGTAYLAILVLVTQRLALRRDLHSIQTLTAVHDKNNAWLGLASALGTAFQQISTSAAPAGVICVALYLIFVFVLHITIPSMLQFIPVNGTQPTHQPTQLSNVSLTTAQFNLIQSYDILSVYNEFEKVGLLENMVYDIIPIIPSATGTTRVNASIYNVNCSAVQNTGQTFLPGTSDGGNDWTYTLQLDSGTIADVIAPYYPAVWTAPVSEFGSHCSENTSYCWQPIIIASTVPIVDASGALPANPWTPILPPVIHQTFVASDSQDNSPIANITAIQALACAVTLNFTYIDVSAVDQLPVPNTISPRVPSTWTAWEWTWPNDVPLTDFRLLEALLAPWNAPPHTYVNTLLNYIAVVPDVSTPIASAPSTAQPSDEQQRLLNSLVTNTSTSQTTQLTVFDTFLMKELGLMNITQNTSSILLDDLNDSMARALAATYWYGRFLNYSDILGTIFATAEPTLTHITEGPGEALIYVTVLNGQLNLSLLPLIVGTVSSIFLLLLSTYLVYMPARHRTTLDSRATFDSAGILQLTWLLGNEPHLADVDMPDVGNLRKAGMFDVQMSEIALGRIKIGQSSGDLSRDTM